MGLSFNHTHGVSLSIDIRSVLRDILYQSVFGINRRSTQQKQFVNLTNCFSYLSFMTNK